MIVLAEVAGQHLAVTDLNFSLIVNEYDGTGTCPICGREAVAERGSKIMYAESDETPRLVCDECGQVFASKLYALHVYAQAAEVERQAAAQAAYDASRQHDEALF